MRLENILIGAHVCEAMTVYILECTVAIFNHAHYQHGFWFAVGRLKPISAQAHIALTRPSWWVIMGRVELLFALVEQWSPGVNWCLVSSADLQKSSTQMVSPAQATAATTTSLLQPPEDGGLVPDVEPQTCAPAVPCLRSISMSGAGSRERQLALL